MLKIAICDDMAVLFPGIGDIKYADEASALSKNASKSGNEVVEKCLEKQK